MASLVDLAKQILEQAKSLQDQLGSIRAPQPSLENGTPWHYPNAVEHPDIFTTRQSIATMSKALFQLSLGPADMMRYITGPERCSLALLKVMDQFNVHDLVPKGGSISFEELASKLNVHSEILRRVFRLAFANNLFKEEPKGHVAHTSLSSAIPLASGWMRLMYRNDFGNAILSWPDAMLQYDESKPLSIPWNVGNGHKQPFFDYLHEEQGGMEMFANAMRSSAAQTGGQESSNFLHGFDWTSLGEGPLVDLGGGSGQIGIAVAKAHPKLKVIIQDLQSNEEVANKTIPPELKDRVSFQVQDFFKAQSVSTGAKAFFMKSIMHDWPDQDASRILKQLLPEVEKGARIFVCDRVPTFTVPRPTQHEAMVQFMDILMWSVLNAKERNVEQWNKLLEMTDERLKVINFNIPVGSEFGMIEIGF